MPQSRQSLERQLRLEQATRETVAARLDGQGIAEADRARHPIWKQVNAKINDLKKRLSAVAAIEAREAAIAAKNE